MSDWSKKPRREKILDVVSDLAGALMYYHRKEDDDLPPGSIEEAVAAGEITVDEICDHFRKETGLPKR